jgi:uncharacterized delta-60 repeat protein
MKKNYLAQLFTFLLLLPLMGWGQQAGSLDRSFNYGMGADYQFNRGTGPNNSTNNLVNRSLIAQPNNKIIIAGNFTHYHGAPRNGIARLNADYGLDHSFNPGSGPNDAIETLALEPNGKIIIGGWFTSYNGVTRNRIARLNEDGSLDLTFIPVTFQYGFIKSIVLQPDGKIIIGGSFSFNGNARGITRLNPDGSLDSIFNQSTEASNVVYSMSLQPDGKIIIGGDFTTFYGAIRNRIARLNADGSLDTTFNPRTGANNKVEAIALQPNGKILIGGRFISYNGDTVNSIARLNTDGSLDTTFNSGSGANSGVYTIALQTDGKVIIGGGFTSINGNSRNRIARLNANGSIDTSFNIGTGVIGVGNYVGTITIQPNGKIFIGGDIELYNNIPTRLYAALNSNGSLVTNFNQGMGANGSVSAISLQQDGKIIIGGTFSRYYGSPRNYIARLNSDGSLDTTFNPGTGPRGGWVETVVLQPDGKIIIGGNFQSYNGININNIARLNTDGSLDSTFNPSTGASSDVNSIALQADGKIIIGGNFLSYNSIIRNRIARLNADGSLDATFNTGTGANERVYSIALQPDNKIIIGGNFTSINGYSKNKIARLNADGSVDTSFNIGTGVIGIGSYVGTIIIQPNSKIIIGGNFNSFNGIVRRQIARLNTNGSLDSTFNTGSILGYLDVPSVNAISLTPNGKLIIGGYFTSINGFSRKRIACLNNDGSLDPSFNPGSGFTNIIESYTTFVSSIIFQRNNKMIIAGNFNVFNNFSTPYIARIHLGSGGCTQPTPPTISGNSTICGGYTTTLTSSVANGNLWSTGDTSQSITVGRAGTYTVNAIAGGCTSAVSAPFVVLNNGPVATTINYDTNSINCLGSRIALTPAGNFEHYLWSNGERTRTINTRYGGTYSVQVANADSCFGSPSPSVSINFGFFWCRVEIYREGLDSISANLWADYYIWYLDGIELLSSNTQKTIPIQGDGVYTFRAVNAGNTSPLSNPIVITSSKKSLAKTVFEVFPNPATDKVTIKTTGSGTLEILNTLGQVIITQPANETNELNLSKLAKGVYTVRFNGGSKILVVK